MGIDDVQGGLVETLGTHKYSSNENTANSVHEPHGEPNNYSEALEHPDTSVKY